MRCPGRNTLLVAPTSIVNSYGSPGVSSVGVVAARAIARAEDAVGERARRAVGKHVAERGGEVGVARRRRDPEHEPHGTGDLERLRSAGPTCRRARRRRCCDRRADRPACASRRRSAGRHRLRRVVGEGVGRLGAAGAAGLEPAVAGETVGRPAALQVDTAWPAPGPAATPARRASGSRPSRRAAPADRPNRRRVVPGGPPIQCRNQRMIERLGVEARAGPKSTSPIFVVLGVGTRVRPRADDQPLVAARVLGAGVRAQAREVGAACRSAGCRTSRSGDRPAPRTVGCFAATSKSSQNAVVARVREQVEVARRVAPQLRAPPSS